MTIAQVYDQYQIMPSLQLHQLQVAAVADYIIKQVGITVDKDRVLTALLLHDMGNIIKFDLDMFPKFLQPEGKEYWQKVKEEYVEMYGGEEDQATLEITKELRVDKEVVQLIDKIGFRQAGRNVQSDDFETKICAYADMRVVPAGVVSLDKRLVDLRDRYFKHYPTDEDQEYRQQCEEFLKTIENQIFKNSKLKPDHITDSSISGTIIKLKKFKL